MAAGRPTDYREEYNEQAYKLCLLGASDAELGNFFKVTEQTINNWKNDHPEFFESIKSGKDVADANVASRLYQRALGFEHDSEDIKVADSTIVRVPIRKIYPLDPTSAIFWLKNRQPKKWRDKQEIDHSSSDGTMATQPTKIVFTKGSKGSDGDSGGTGTKDE